MSAGSLRLWSCLSCFMLESKQPGSPKFLVCGGCNDAHYCSQACQRRDWKMHKPTCKTVAAGQDESESSAMANPSVAALDAALREFSQTKLFDVVVAFITRSAFGLWAERASPTSSTHILCLLFVFDPNQTPTDGRRHQFKLLAGGLKRLEDVFKAPGELATHLAERKKFERSSSGISGELVLAPAMLSACSPPAKSANSKPGVIHRYRWCGFKMGEVNWCTLSPVDDWIGFAQRAFEGPVPRSAGDLHVMRGKEIGREIILVGEV